MPKPYFVSSLSRYDHVQDLRNDGVAVWIAEQNSDKRERAPSINIRARPET